MVRYTSTPNFIKMYFKFWVMSFNYKNKYRQIDRKPSKIETRIISLICINQIVSWSLIWWFPNTLYIKFKQILTFQLSFLDLNTHNLTYQTAIKLTRSIWAIELHILLWTYKLIYLHSATSYVFKWISKSDKLFEKNYLIRCKYVCFEFCFWGGSKSDELPGWQTSGPGFIHSFHVQV